jgi:hypothetical protein
LEPRFAPLPLVIGVTGHRDLRDQDVAALEAAVDGIFRRLKADYRTERGPTPIIVLSALAEGADQLVARVAQKNGAQLIAPMPMPTEEYRRDFEHGIKPNAAQDFDAWLEAPIPKPVVPFTSGNSIEAVRNQPERRNEQYRAVGLFIVRHCDILIALWDGQDRGKAVGGTAEIVDFKLNGIGLAESNSARASLDAPEIGPVIHVVTPRMKSAEAPAVSVAPWGKEFLAQFRTRLAAIEAETVADDEAKAKRAAKAKELKRAAERWTALDILVTLTRQFNRDCRGLVAKEARREEIKESLDQLFEKPDGQHDQEARGKAVETAGRWCDLYGVADALAQKWQRRFRRDWIWLFVLGFSAFGFFEIFAHLAPIGEQLHMQDHYTRIIDVLLLAGYVIAFLVVYVVFALVRARQDQERFLDYRALAEALRVAIFWKLNGIGSVADAYPIKLPRELAWVKTCLLNEELLDFASETPAAAPDPRSYGWTRTLWVDAQLAYFRCKGPSHLEAAERRERISLYALLAAVIFAIALLAGRSYDPQWLAPFVQHHHWGQDLLLFFIGILPGVAAVFVGYAEQLAFRAQSRQFDRMRELFERALYLLPPTPDPAQSEHVRCLFREIGSEAMRENAEWVAIYRQRPLRPHS